MRYGRSVLRRKQVPCNLISTHPLAHLFFSHKRFPSKCKTAQTDCYNDLYLIKIDTIHLVLDIIKLFINKLTIDILSRQLLFQ